MMAVFVSRFGCFMSTTSPHLKRESSLFQILVNRWVVRRWS